MAKPKLITGKRFDNLMNAVMNEGKSKVSVGAATKQNKNSKIKLKSIAEKAKKCK